jgi:octaprenyl-diphosphate synthase
MAFQIKDDLSDYSEDAIGKPTGIDIKEQKNDSASYSCFEYVYFKEKTWLINSIKTIIKIKNVKEVIAL